MSAHAGIPRCEDCGREPATSLSWFVDRARWYAPRSGTWRFTGACTAERESYYVMLHHHGRGFLDSPAERAGWLAHLREKVWFDPADFSAMLARFAVARRPVKGRRAQRSRINVKMPARARTLPRLEPVS